MVVDRIEGDLAVVEIGAGNFENVPISHISGAIRDGVVLISNGSDGYLVDEAETQRRSKITKRRTESLFK